MSLSVFKHKRITGPRWQRIVAFIVGRDGGRCWLCGKPGATSADHVIALADGGDNSPGNLRAAHPRCNYAKNGKRSAAIRSRSGRARRGREHIGAIDPHAIAQDATSHHVRPHS